MTAVKGNLLIAQGGGPTAVINASLVGAVSEACSRLDDSCEVWGARGGAVGLLEETFIDLRRQPQSLWERIREAPAAALGSCRKKMDDRDVERSIKVFQRHDIRHFFYIGGNDSMDTANRIAKGASDAEWEMHAAGIPKTIDNDLPETDFCPGYGSCARYVAQAAIDLGMDIRALPTPVSIMEVIGRNAGWTAAASLLARREPDDAPHLIYVPEIAFVKRRFLNDVQTVYDRFGWVVIVVSEGLQNDAGQPIAAGQGDAAVDGFGHRLPGEVAATLAHWIREELGLRARSEKPGLLARASSHHASPVDRDAAEGVGRHAVRKAFEGATGFMAAIVRERNDPLQLSFRSAPLDKVANFERKLPLDFVSESGNDIEESFREYAEPLLGEPLRRYASVVR